jgi:hypothetical protein
MLSNEKADKESVLREIEKLIKENQNSLIDD